MKPVHSGSGLRTLLPSLILLLIGCGSVPVSLSRQGDTGANSYRYAFTRNDCAPWDGAAVRINLSSKPQDKNRVEPPYLAITVYKALSELSEKTFILDGPKIGSAIFCPESGNCLNLKSGKVQFKKVQRDKSVEGDYELEFVNGTRQKGHFLSKWIEVTRLCG